MLHVSAPRAHPIVLVLLQLVYCATCTAPRCSLHSSKGRPAWSPSMLLVAAAAAEAVAAPLSAPSSSSRAHCCRASKRARCRSRHTLAATQVPSSAALSLRRSLCTLCNLAAPSTHIFSTRCRCSPCRAPSAAARAMCSDTCRRLEEAQGAGAGAGQQGEPIGQYGDALGLWLLEGCVNG